ncbi:MAG: NAD(P)/FAD-dependent oxidoreductase [Clostridia bacterium]|nr:NAD(P)/FAD-dependent oxidoreductase [Clostridia bacterium]
MAKILIIGGGVSGLSCGIYSLLAGHSAVIVEKNAFPGGNLTGWDRRGFHIDNCVHWLCGTNPASEMYGVWRELGALGDIPVHFGESLFTCEYEGKRLSLYSDIERLRRDMLALSPEDRRETEKLIRAVRAVQGFCGIAGEGHNESSGPAARAAALPLLFRYYRLTAGELAEKFKSPLIRRFLTSFLTEKFGSLGLIFVMSDFCGHNAGVPRGGSTAMAERIASRFESLGGILLTGREAEKLKLKGNRAVSLMLGGGEELSADAFVLAADPAALFGKVIPAPMPAQIARMTEDRRLFRFSSWHCAFECGSEKLPFSGDFVIDLPENHRSFAAFGRIALREFSHEPGFAPPGKNIIQTLAFLDEAEARKLTALAADEEQYKKKKTELAEAAAEAIEKAFPVLAGKLRPADVWTPATYSRYFGSEFGSYMSFAFSSRFLPRPAGCAVKGLSNVLLATQWQQPPGGLPIAASAGKRAAERADELLRRMSGADVGSKIAKVKLYPTESANIS